jgi:hypothetical protein
MQNAGRYLAILIVVTLAMPAAARAESIRGAAVREVAAVRLGQTQAAPIIWRSTRTPRLLPIQIGAAVGCGVYGYAGLRFGSEYNQQFRGLVTGCLTGALFGAAIGYVASAR